MVVAFDFDGVLNNLPDVWMNYLNKKYNTNLTELSHYNMSLNYPELTLNQILEPLYSEDFWKTVTPVKCCEYDLRSLPYNTDYIVVTSTDPATWNAKYYGCIKNNFPFLSLDKFILCNEKWRIKCDILVDDFVDNFNNFDGYRMLKQTSYNRNVLGNMYDSLFVDLGDVTYLIHERNEEWSETIDKS